jgi:hypothetical protein
MYIVCSYIFRAGVDTHESQNVNFDLKSKDRVQKNGLHELSE